MQFIFLCVHLENIYIDKKVICFLPEGPFCKLGEVIVAEVDFHQDLQIVESTLVDCLVVSFE